MLQSSKPEIHLLNHVHCKKEGNGEAVWERVNERVKGRGVGRTLNVLVSKAEGVIHLES